jgi:glycosyltransferase involved in cell wall biosynthesis
MVAYSFYESDSRIIQYARALVQRGDSVDVIALRRPGAPKHEVIHGVNVYRIQQREVNERGPFSYVYRILKFLFLATFILTARHMKRRYQLVHVHSVPDLLVAAAIPVRWLGARVILDIHDILPEFYASKFKTKTDSMLYGLLLQIERWSARRADHVIVANPLWHERLTHRATRQEKCSMIGNYPNPEIFHPRATEKTNGHFVLMYPGSLNWHQGVDVAIRAFARAKEECPDIEFRIYGEGPAKPALQELVKELGLNGSVQFNSSLPTEQIADVMATADLGVVPKRASSSFGNEAASTKIQEFMAVEVPLVVSHTRIDGLQFDDSKVKFFESENEAELAECILTLKRHPELRARLVANATAHIRQNNWDIKKQDYLALVDALTAKAQPRAGAAAPQERE